ncbi:MAG TPA: hypothetical protein VNS46_10175 [Nocardioides sp.]|nr:hypothetical protein [Nocardioides sp.]
MTEAVAVRYPTPTLVRTADGAAKTLLVLLLLMVVIDPDGSNLRDKAAAGRAIGYPLVSFTVPAIWLWLWKDRASFPWLADLLVTLTCFTDILGNRMDLYDTVVWFDDLMHLANTGMIAAAVVLLTLHRSAPVHRVVERALAVGATAAITWEIAEYYAFISGHAEHAFAYEDTLGDLALGVLGSLTAALVIHRTWRSGGLREAAPQLDDRHLV